MIQRISSGTRRSNSGFTLIELLVVIVILGILAATVVFAVRGVGDKGKSSAVSVDERTIRTAEESYCASTGHYGTPDELVAAKLLSEKPTLNGVSLDSPGPCGSTSYDIFPTELPAVDGLNGTVCEPGAWCDAPLANGSGTAVNGSGQNINANKGLGSSPGLVLLNDGRVFAVKGKMNNTNGSNSGANVGAFSIFDPSVGPMGAWSPAAPPSSVAATTPPGSVPNVNGVPSGSASPILVIKGGPDWCGTNCGKVLAKFGGAQPSIKAIRRLYDPNTSALQADGVTSTGSLGSWTDLSNADPIPSTPGVPGGGGPYQRTFSEGIVQLTRTPCGAICGKFLIVGGRWEDSGFIPTPPDPEIWDPADGPIGSFRKLGLDTGFDPTMPGPIYSATLLEDGKVMILGGTMTQIFDPLTEKFTTATPAPFNHSNQGDQTVLLPNGKVLVTFNAELGVGQNRIGVYDPAGAGSWADFNGCGDGGTNRFCYVLTTLPNGKVLAKRGTNSNQLAPTTLPLQLFDPATNTWNPTVAPTPIRNVVRAVTVKETQPGSCGDLCNRVLAVGSSPVGTTGAWTTIYTPTP